MSSSIQEKNTSFDNMLCLELGRAEIVHKWRRMPECAEFVGIRRSKHTVVAYKDALYVFGGDNGKSMLNDLLRFDLKEKVWSKPFSTGTPPTPRYHHSAVIYGTSMFVFGGYTGDIHSNSNLANKNDLFEYKLHSGQWHEWKFAGEAPVPRSAHGAAVYDNKLWIFAGYDGNARLNDMWTFPLTGETRLWERVEQKGHYPPTCCNFPVCVARECMFVFSGQSGAKITNSLFQFNFKQKFWKRISTEHILRGSPAPPARRYGHSMVSYKRHLFVFGGAAESNVSNDLHCFDLDSHAWSIVQPAPDSQVPSGRLFHAGTVVGDAMFIFGGTIDNNVRCGDMYRFQFSNYPKCTLHEDYGKLFTTKQFADLIFVVGNAEVEIKAHIPFIAARSNYLRSKIQQGQEIINHIKRTDKTYVPGEFLEVRIPDIDPIAFEMVLSYIYIDSIDPTKYSRSEEELQSNRIVLRMMDVYRLSLQFVMTRLEHLCLQYLNSAINIRNVLVVFHNANQLQLEFIKEHCLRFIVKDVNYSQIVMSIEFETLDRSLMVEIIRRKQAPHNKTHSEHSLKSLGCTLEEDLANFLKAAGRRYSDIQLVLENHTVAAHKCILAARSGYFEGMFRSFMPTDSKVRIQIGDIVPSFDAFQSLLRYIYCADVKMPPEDSLYLFSAPLFYGFTNNRLQAFCKENLEMNVTFENVLQILEAADKMQAMDMKKYAIDIIVHHFAKVAKQPTLKLLSKELILEILMAVAESMTDHRTCQDVGAVSQINNDM